jgi:peptidoglycan/LPS O-acetylase OafA/YrhL
VISAKGAGSFGMFDHFWSLAVEEHFYFVWPTIVFFCNRRTLMIVAGSAWAVALGLRLACVHGDALLPYAAYMATPMRMDSLAAGAFIALAARGPNGIAGLVRPAFMVGGAAMACFVAMVAIRRSFEPRDVVTGTIGMSLLWAFFAAALVLTLKWRPLTDLMSLDVLRWFGKYSYGMYVWHPIVFMIAFHNDWARGLRGAPTPLHAVLNAGAAVAVMLAVTLASWHLWEKQFLKLKDRFA